MKRIFAASIVLAGLAAVASAIHYVGPAKYGEAFTLHFSIYDSNSPWQFYETAPAADDLKVRKNGGTWARATNSVTDLDHTMSLLLTATEMQAAVVTVDVNDESSPALFGSDTWVIYTYGNASAQHAFDLDTAMTDDTIADQVWDESLQGNSHQTKFSAGWYLKRIRGGESEVVLHSGTAVSATSNTITLDTGAVATADIYNGNLIVITGGTGLGQTRIVADYSADRVVTVDKDWAVTPDATSTFEIRASASAYFSDIGLAQAGGPTSITLATTASATDNIYNNSFVAILSGTGSGQTRVIIAYNGTTKVATVAAWDTQPDATSVYAVIPTQDYASDTTGDIVNANVVSWLDEAVGALTTATALAELNQEKMDSNSVDLDAILAKLTMTLDELEDNIRGSLNSDLTNIYNDVNNINNSITNIEGDITSIVEGDITVVVDTNSLTNILATGTVATVTDAARFTLSTDFLGVNNAYRRGTLIAVTDATSGKKAMGIIRSYTAERLAVLYDPLPFTPEVNDTTEILAGWFEPAGWRP